MNNIKDFENLNQKKILLRLDLNVPLENIKITDTTRIDKILPTINHLLKNNSKIIILSHVGRPKGKIIIFEFCLIKNFKVGRILSILVVSIIFPFSNGTFKSSLNKTFFLLRSS